jgi:hypothetical protein
MRINCASSSISLAVSEVRWRAGLLDSEPESSDDVFAASSVERSFS